MTHLSTRISQRARADVSRIVPALKNGNNLVEKHRTLLAPAAVNFDLRSVRFMRQNAAASINIIMIIMVTTTTTTTSTITCRCASNARRAEVWS